MQQRHMATKRTHHLGSGLMKSRNDRRFAHLISSNSTSNTSIPLGAPGGPLSP
jgi:hypothetical protein